MSQDQQTYNRATTASLIGLATQLLLTLMLGVLGIYAGSKALVAGTFYLIPGLWIWAFLWMLYKQHRLERDEALEAAQLADSDARSAAIFDEAGNQLAQAKRRLENLYKWGMPVVSLLTALYLLAVGGLLFYLNNSALQSGVLVETPLNEGINAALVGLLLVVGALGGFLVARYVAGMTRVDEWQALRGGASTLIGNVFLAIVPFAVAVGALFFPGSDAGFVYLAIALPIVMILLGLEIVLGLVLGFYRPRKAGVFFRPAFDSRILGWLTRPESIGKIFSETINYQFGFEVSKSWFMRLLGKALLPLAIVCIAVIIAMSCAVIVEPHQQAVVTNNGAFVRIADPGISFKAPWPFGRAEKYDVNRVHSIRLGSRAHIDDEHAMGGPILWTNQHVEEGQQEKLLITAPPPGVGNAETDSTLGEMLGADIDVKYRIADLAKYVGIDSTQRGSADPIALIRSIAEHEVTRYFATHDSDTLLSHGRAQAGDEIRTAIQDELNAYNTGLEVVYVSVSGVHPPQDVAESYHGRINALQEQQTSVESARQEADMILAGLAGSRERADRLSSLIDAYKALDQERQGLDAKADAARVAEINRQLDRQWATLEQLMSDSGGKIGQRLAEARSLRWGRSLEEQTRYIKRGTDTEAFNAAPRYFVVSRYLDALVSAMAERPKTVIGPTPDAEKPNIVLDLPQGALPGFD